jgi:hypothetical protein
MVVRLFRGKLPWTLSWTGSVSEGRTKGQNVMTISRNRLCTDCTMRQYANIQGWIKLARLLNHTILGAVSSSKWGITSHCYRTIETLFKGRSDDRVPFAMYVHSTTDHSATGYTPSAVNIPCSQHYRAILAYNTIAVSTWLSVLQTAHQIGREV